MLLQKGWSWKPKLAAPVIDFETLLNEWKEKFNLDSGNLKSLKSTSSQTKTKKGKQIKNLVKSNWLKVAIVSFAFFVSSSYDLISDGLLTHSFIGGTNYTKQVRQPDSKLTNKTQCPRTDLNKRFLPKEQRLSQHESLYPIGLKSA